MTDYILECNHFDQFFFFIERREEKEGGVEEHPTLSRTSSEVWATSEAQKGLVEWLRTNSRTQSGKKITRLFWGTYLEAIHSTSRTVKRQESHSFRSPNSLTGAKT